MILVTQGHEKSISLEIFFKSFLCLPFHAQSLITLFVVKETLQENLKALKIPFSINKNKVTFLGHTVNCHFVSKISSETSDCLAAALVNIKSDDILFTLPSTKSEFTLKGEILHGHTEYFRKKYNLSELSMFFFSERLKVLLVTDHIPLSKVATSITPELITSKVKNVLKRFVFTQVALSGINPHCGEEGLLGTEDTIVSTATQELKRLYPKVNITGPVAGDSLHRLQAPDHLLVYMYHDQGLSMFKSLAQGFSINCTLGLPFLRLSVDHGTALELFGKNMANYQSCLYGLTKAVEFHENKTQFHQN